jgi:hypothetical protein
MNGVRVRVMTWDICSPWVDRSAVAGIIRRLGPDVVCLQGVGRWLQWRSRCAALARRAGLLMAAGGRADGANIVLVSSRVGARTPARPASRAGPPRDGMAVACAEVAGVRFVVGAARMRRRAQDQAWPALDPTVTLRPFGGDHQILCCDLDGQPADAILVSAGVTVLDRWSATTPQGSRTGGHRPVVADLEMPLPERRDVS